MVMGAVWMLGESKLRQFLVPNASALGSLCFVMILLCPLPILFFEDSLQKGLHHRFYVCLGSIAMINFAVCTILTAAGIADYIETMPVSHGILAITVAKYLYTFSNIYAPKKTRPTGFCSLVCCQRSCVLPLKQPPYTLSH